MRIGELVKLDQECVRELGSGVWAVHVPVGKLHSERWVPADHRIRDCVMRIRFLRTLQCGDDGESPRWLLPRPRGRHLLMQQLRAALNECIRGAGIGGHVVPHQLRHTFATSMVRAGVSFPALMKMLGHTTPRMTLRYVDVTQVDLQREYRAALARTPHCAALVVGRPVSQPAGLTGVQESLLHTQRLLEMYRRSLPSGMLASKLVRLANRLTKIASILRSCAEAEK